MKRLIPLAILIFIVGCAPKKAFFASDNVSCTSLLKTKGASSSLKKTACLVKVNDKYNKYYGNGGSYNVSGNLNINTLIPCGNTTLEVIYKGMPPVSLIFNGEENREYTILADDDSKKCIKVYRKDEKNNTPVSECGKEIIYQETPCSNCATVTTKLTVLKLDGLYGKHYGLFPVYVFPENYVFKIEAGNHKFEVISSYSWKPSEFNCTLENGKNYEIVTESKNGEWWPAIVEKTTK